MHIDSLYKQVTYLNGVSYIFEHDTKKIGTLYTTDASWIHQVNHRVLFYRFLNRLISVCYYYKNATLLVACVTHALLLFGRKKNNILWFYHNLLIDVNTAINQSINQEEHMCINT